jgi:hypothetical protein
MNGPHPQQRPEPDQTTNGTPRTRGAVDGASFILDAPATCPRSGGRVSGSAGRRANRC